MSEIATEAELDEPAPPPPPGELAGQDDQDNEPEADADDLDDLEIKPPERPKAAKLGKQTTRTVGVRETKAMSELRNNTDTALKEWMESLSPNGGVKVRVTRTSPKIWKGLNVGGSLATYDHYIDEDWIREHHGGGNFMLEVKKPRVNGAGWQIAGSRAISIAGDPRTDDVFRDGAAPTGQTSTSDNGMGKLAIGVLRDELAAARAQGAAHGLDPMAIQAIVGPMQSQNAQLSAMIRDLQSQLAQAQQGRPPERDEFREKMLSAMIDGDSARLASIRTQHESEIRQLKQAAIDMESRLRDAFERDKSMLSMAHERELNALRSAYDMKVASQETLNLTTRTLLDGENRRLEGALTEAKAELAALRLKKDKSTLEQAQEFAAMKDAMGEIFGDSEKEKSTLEKVMEVAGNLPAVQGMLNKVTGEQQEAPPQPQFVAAPARRPQLLTGPDGNLYRQNPNGTMQLIMRRQQGPQGPLPRQPAPAPAVPDIAPATVKIAVDFLESAYRNGQEPTEVATSVRSMIPTDVMDAIRNLGIDGFLTSVAKLDASSPLANQAGRNWTRKLGRALVGDA